MGRAKSWAAKKMRDLRPNEREAAIEASPDVLDLRPRIRDRLKNGALAADYRTPRGAPPWGTA